MVVLDLTTLLIWTLRIVLPILFFGIYFRLKAPSKPRPPPGPSGNAYSRAKLLRYRKAVASQVPDSMKSIALKDQSQAPHLFGGSGRASRSDRSSRRAPDEQRAPKEKRETKEKKEKKEPDPTPEALAFSEERMHLESLLNYVAFTRQEDQRDFLFANAQGGPPRPTPTKERDAEADTKQAVISGVAAEKANDEAQMVLKGAMKMKRCDVARSLYEQLTDSQVEVAEGTFKLMIEACCIADDLKGASDFVMKMETAGFLPQTDVLDMVMDLYVKQKEQAEAKEAEGAEKADKEEPEAKEADDHLRAAAQEAPQPQPSAPEAAAMAQVPMMPMTMFNWDAIASSDEDEDDDDEPKAAGVSTKLSSDAPEFVPGFIPSAP